MIGTGIRMVISETTKARLDALRVKTEVDSHAEVIRNALKLYEFVVNEAGLDASIVYTGRFGETIVTQAFRRTEKDVEL